MTMEPLIRAIAGTFVLASLALGYVHGPYWHLFTAFVGLNLLQSGFTKWCLRENILFKMGIRKPCGSMQPMNYSDASGGVSAVIPCLTQPAPTRYGGIQFDSLDTGWSSSASGGPV